MDRDGSYESDSDMSYTENPIPLSRADRMRLSGRSTPDSGYAALQEMPVNRHRKRKETLSKEEIALRRSETARRRKAQAHMKAEEAKINTIHKLLRRQASRKSTAPKEYPEPRTHKQSAPLAVRYLYSKSGSFLSIPLASLERTNLSFGITSQDRYPEPQRCSLDGCDADKIYKHPSSGARACCLEHYKIVSKS